jgi:hypothetical protein
MSAKLVTMPPAGCAEAATETDELTACLEQVRRLPQEMQLMAYQAVTHTLPSDPAAGLLPEQCRPAKDVDLRDLLSLLYHIATPGRVEPATVARLTTGLAPAILAGWMQAEDLEAGVAR